MAGRDLVGSMLGGFAVMEKLGEGGMGTVYLAKQDVPRRRVALKVLKEQANCRKQDAAEARFMREVMLAAQIQHPYAPAVYESGIESDGTKWMAMEFVRGVSIDEWLRKRGPMSLEQVVTIFERLAKVLHSIHKLGIVHRDVKARNVMLEVCDDGEIQPKLLDYGIAFVSDASLEGARIWPEGSLGTGDDELAKEASREASQETIQDSDPDRLTPEGMPMGSWAYMAPEQWADSRSVTPSADVYSLGVLLYKMLTNRVPFTGKSEIEYHGHHKYSAVPTLGPGFSHALDRVIERAMAKAPTQRYESALELATALREVFAATQRELLRNVVRVWDAADRPRALLLRGKTLEGVERWTKESRASGLSKLERSFLTQSRRSRRWIKSIAAVVTISAALFLLEYRAYVTEQAQSESLTQIEVERGRQALLNEHEEEARNHLTLALARGDHSHATTFMLSRANSSLGSMRATLNADSGPITSIEFSPDGTQLVSSDAHGAQLWSGTNFQKLERLPHADSVGGVAYSANGAHVLTAGHDGLVKMWDKQGNLLRQFHSEKQETSYARVTVSRDSHYIAAIDTQGDHTDIWDWNTGRLAIQFQNAHPIQFYEISFSADSRYFASTGGGETSIVDLQTSRIRTVGSDTRCLVFAPNGVLLLVGDVSGRAAIWSAETGNETRLLQSGGEAVSSVAWSRDGELVAVGLSSGDVHVYEASSGIMRASYHLRDGIRTLSFDSNGRNLLAASSGGTVMLFSLANQVAIARFTTGSVTSAKYSPDESVIVVASWDGTARVWPNSATYRRWSSPIVRPRCNISRTMIADDRYIAVSCLGGPTRIWDSSKELLLAELPAVSDLAGYETPVAAVSSSGDKVAVIVGNRVDLYTMPGGVLAESQLYESPVTVVLFDALGSALIVGTADGSVMTSSYGGAPHLLTKSDAGIDSIIVTSDRKLLFTDSKKSVKIFDIATNRIACDAKSNSRAGMMRVSTSLNRFITVPNVAADASSAPQLWQLGDCKELAVLTGHVGRVFSARFLEHEVLTTGNDGYVRAWDAATGRAHQLYQAGTRYVADAALSPSGDMLVAGDGEGSVYFWDRATARLLWKMRAHKLAVVGLHWDGLDLVTRGFAGDLAKFHVGER